LVGVSCSPCHKRLSWLPLAALRDASCAAHSRCTQSVVTTSILPICSRKTCALFTRLSRSPSSLLSSEVRREFRRIVGQRLGDEQEAQVERYMNALPSRASARWDTLPVASQLMNCPGRNLLSLLLHCRPKINLHRLSDESVFKWAELLSSGSVSFDPDDIPAEIISLNVPPSVNREGSVDNQVRSTPRPSSRHRSASTELSRPNRTAFTWTSPIEDALRQFDNIRNSDSASSTTSSQTLGTRRPSVSVDNFNSKSNLVYYLIPDVYYRDVSTFVQRLIERDAHRGAVEARATDDMSDADSSGHE